MAITIPDEAKPVIKRAELLGIPLTKHIDHIVKTYVDGGVRGIKFLPKNYHGLQLAVDRAIKKMVLLNDNFNDSVGMIIGSDARKHGFIVSAREKNPANSLHVELSSVTCDFHLDSNSITTGEDGVLKWGGQYNPLRFVPHGIKDLFPSMIEDSRFSFASPLLAPILKRLDLQVNAKGHKLILDGNMPKNNALDNAALSSPSLPSGGKSSQIVFTLTFNH